MIFKNINYVTAYKKTGLQKYTTGGELSNLRMSTQGKGVNVGHNLRTL